MITLQVNSTPLKDVIISLSKSFEVSYSNNCGEYSLKIPEHIGKGSIRGINFENGLGLIIYNAIFKEDIRLEFTLNEVHPVKFINSIHGPLTHEFANENIKHSIEEFRCAIVASEQKNGHIIEFEKDILHEVTSVEIDRIKFSKKENCELKQWNSKLKKVLTDVEGIKQFYHVGNCGVFFKDVVKEISKYKTFILAQKLNLQSITIEMFIHQLVQYDDDSLNSEKSSVLRIQELKRVEEVGVFIKDNLSGDLSIKNLSRQTGLNPNKLQIGFKYMFSTTINEFITNVRLEQSNVLLRNKEYNVRDVVTSIGLESSSYFSKIYKNKYGITPKNYKKMFS
ncbi:helix-turn-helix transcriptional regulator [Halpernia frigidisoli]|uniref:Transcriptional regulator, AraC family n=1 Tax=Halpernia frigidisoli TaxID=1125876 RepID=A0A1I3D0Q4_9FLAO|nr:AraC family transcriptional regulator [Halpernia frigidisoli]SFH80292.1 transcriptional regulator, AraC family [Halpernia frigidisoli]